MLSAAFLIGIVYVRTYMLTSNLSLCTYTTHTCTLYLSLTHTHTHILQDYYMTPPQSDPHPSPLTPPLYAQVPLWSVLHWDSTMRETVLLEAFLITHDRSA